MRGAAVSPTEWREEAFKAVFPPGAVRVAEYNYEGSYEGSGSAIALVDGQFASAEYSHCSCYGPGESMTYNGLFGTLVDALRATNDKDELLKSLTAEVG